MLITRYLSRHLCYRMVAQLTRRPDRGEVFV
jgi:hypothetical protein